MYSWNDRPWHQFPDSRLARQSFVRAAMELANHLHISRCNNIDKAASQERILTPGQVIPCILHPNISTTEKILTQLLEIGLHFNSACLDEAIKKSNWH